MKTFITTIYGGGAPLYLISAESEKRAWELIKEALDKHYRRNFSNVKELCNGLIEVDGWYANDERIVNIHELYSKESILFKGSFSGLA